MGSDKSKAIEDAKQIIFRISECTESEKNEGIDICSLLSKIEHLKVLMETCGLTAQDLGTTQEDIDGLPRKVYLAKARSLLGCINARGQKTLVFVIMLTDLIIKADATPEDLGITDPKLIEKIADYRQRLVAKPAEASKQ